MRKSFRQLIIVLAIVSGSVLSSNAQELGVRFGNISSGNNFAIDGIFSLGPFNRIHADVSFGQGGIGFDALWDFLYRPLGDEDINWYLGVGPYMRIDDPFWLGAAFEAGLEYRFEIVPIALGVDWRPSVSIIQKTKFHWNGFGLNVRYVFGN